MKVHSVLASFFVILCLGGLYAWSFFVPMMKAQLLYSTLQTQLITGFTLGFFALSMLVAGKLERRFGSRLMTLVGGLFLTLGYEVAGFSAGNFWIFCLGISVFAGLGTACCYVSCLVTPAKNFPEQRGLVVGISSAGFGGGAIALTWFAKALIRQWPETDLLSLLQFIGLAYGLICVCSFYFIHHSQSDLLENNPEGNNQLFLWKDSRFISMFLTMFAGSFGGLLVLSNLKPMVLHHGFADHWATMAISLYAIGNMFGRVFWGYVSDKIGVDTSLFFAFSILIASMLCIQFFDHAVVIMLAAVLGVGLGFSSNFVLFPSKTSQLFGIHNFGLVYPNVFLAYGLAGITGPIAAGYLFDHTGSYTYSIFISAGVAFSGMVFYRIVNSTLLARKSRVKVPV